MRFLFVDRILELVEGSVIRGIKHVTADDPFLYADAPRLPYFPSALIGETLGQLAAWNAMATQAFQLRPVAGIVSDVGVFRPVRVGETLLLEAHIDQLDQTVVAYHGSAHVGEEEVFTLTALGPMLPMHEFIDEALVRLQFQRLYRPGPWPHVTTHSRAIARSPTHVAIHAYFEFDSILASTDQSITAEKHISFSSPYFPDHFPNKPVLPLTILLECIVNLAKQWLPKTLPPLARLKKVKMKDFIQPGDVIQTTLTLQERPDHTHIIQSYTEREGKRVSTAQLTFQDTGHG